MHGLTPRSTPGMGPRGEVIPMIHEPGLGPFASGQVANHPEELEAVSLVHIDISQHEMAPSLTVYGEMVRRGVVRTHIPEEEDRLQLTPDALADEDILRMIPSIIEVAAVFPSRLEGMARCDLFVSIVAAIGLDLGTIRPFRDDPFSGLIRGVRFRSGQLLRHEAEGKLG